MLTQSPEVAQARHGRPGCWYGQFIVVVYTRIIDPLDQDVDLSGFEACQLEAEIQVQEGQFPEFQPKRLLVPGTKLGQAIVGNPESPDPTLGQVAQPDRWDSRQPDPTRRIEPSLACDDFKVFIHQHGHDEPELLDAR